MPVEFFRKVFITCRHLAVNGSYQDHSEEGNRRCQLSKRSSNSILYSYQNKTQISALTNIMVVFLYTFFLPHKSLGLRHHRRWRFLLSTSTVAGRRLPSQHCRTRCRRLNDRLRLAMHSTFSITSF